MRVALIVVASVALFLLLIFYPFKIKTAIHINFLEDVGFGAVKVLDFKLFCARFRISKNGKFEVNNAVKKKKKKKKNKLIKKCYTRSLLKLLHIKKLEVLFDAGLEENAYFIAMLCGYLSVTVSSLMAALMNKYKHIKTFFRVNPMFSANRLEVSGSLVISFSLFHMFLSIIYAYWFFIKEKLKEKKNG